MAGPKDAWSVLGIPAGSPPEMVRAQYLRLVRVNHPDRFAADPVERRRHEELMKDITWAYQEIVHGRATVHAPPPPRRPTATPRSARSTVNPQDLQCRRHGRWAVGYCTICSTPLCSRCDEALTGYCDVHRPWGGF